MGNPISKELTSGTLGELLVQIRLLETGVQAAPPLKDSGNDLIALKGRIVNLVQVKTCDKSKQLNRKQLPEIYDVLAVVDLCRDPESGAVRLDDSKIYLWQKCEVERSGWSSRRFDPGHELINRVFDLWTE